MSLSVLLRDVTLSHGCPYCGHEIRKKGRWFNATVQYKCMSCRRLVRLGHSERMKLFNRHAHLAGG